MNDTQILRSLMESMQKTSQPKTSPYDTTAEVRRIEDGIAWVHIAGGVDETPVRLTINAKEGDSVQVRVSGGTAFLVGNGTSPPTDDRVANIAQKTATNAQIAADTAIADAERAKNAADSAQASADSAAASAASAQASANNANEYASRALGGLSTVQSVVETLNWITQHGTMTLTTDTEIDPAHVYFVQDAQGDYVVGSTHYSIVTEPSADDLSTYYVLSIDESLQNYVGTHLAVTGEGLWVLPAATGYKVLIATGQGQTYREAGTYIIDGSGNTVARFGQTAQIGGSSTGYTLIDSDGMEIYRGTVKLANIGYGSTNRETSTSSEPFYTLGDRSISLLTYSATETYRIGEKVSYNNEAYVCIYPITTAESWTRAHWLKIADVRIGAYSMAEGYGTAAVRMSDHAEGRYAFAQGPYSHAEGYYTVAGTESSDTALAAHAEGSHTAALEQDAHSEGNGAVALGIASHAQNADTIAAGIAQTALGRCNVKDTNEKYAVIVGNGTSPSARSNALTIDWSGNVKAAGHVSGKLEELTITRVNNSYCNATSIGRLYACRKNGFLYLRGNLELSANVPTGTSETTVATISGWIAVASDYHTVAGQSGGGVLGLYVTYDGNLRIYNTSGAAATGFHRFSVVVPVHPNYD